MKKFEICTDNFQFEFGKYKASIPAATPDEIFRWCMERTCIEPKKRASFDTLEEAQAEFAKNYADYGCTRAEKGMIFWLLVGEIAWIEENWYDDDGEFDQGGWTYDVSAQGYEPEDREED